MSGVDVTLCLLIAGSLWHKDRWLPCTERSYYGAPSKYIIDIIHRAVTGGGGGGRGSVPVLCDTPQYDPTSADWLTSPDLTARAPGSRNLIELDGEKVRDPGLGKVAGLREL